MLTEFQAQKTIGRSLPQFTLALLLVELYFLISQGRSPAYLNIDTVFSKTTLISLYILPMYSLCFVIVFLFIKIFEKIFVEIYFRIMKVIFMRIRLIRRLSKAVGESMDAQFPKVSVKAAESFGYEHGDSEVLQKIKETKEIQNKLRDEVSLYFYNYILLILIFIYSIRESRNFIDYTIQYFSLGQKIFIYATILTAVFIQFTFLVLFSKMRNDMANNFTKFKELSLEKRQKLIEYNNTFEQTES